jgi:hypothetical protein
MAYRDGADLAQRLQRDLISHGFDAWLGRQRLKGGATNHLASFGNEMGSPLL